MPHVWQPWLQTQKKPLTGYVIVLPLEELQTPQVGAEFLKLERELYITVWFVAVQQRRVSLVNGAALQLTSRDQEDSVELLLSPRGSICPGAHNVHLVPYLWIQDETLTRSKPVIKERNTTLKKKQQHKNPLKPAETGASSLYAILCLNLMDNKVATF